MVTHSIGGKRARTIAEANLFLRGARTLTTLHYDARRGALRVVGGPGGRYVTDDELRKYCQARGIDFDALADIEEQEQEARAEVLARRADAQTERHIAQLTDPDIPLDLCQGVR